MTDGKVVRHVFITAPFTGPVFGMHVGDRLSDAQDLTDLRFDTFVTPHRTSAAEAAPAEAVSNSLEGLRVTLLLDPASRDVDVQFQTEPQRDDRATFGTGRRHLRQTGDLPELALQRRGD